MAQAAPKPRAAQADNAPALCGLWSGPKRSTAVLLDPVTKLQLPISLVNTEQARCMLLAWLANQSAHLVIPDTLLGEPFLNQAGHTPLAVWIAPSALLEAIRLTTGLTPPAHPSIPPPCLPNGPPAPALRPFLRRLIACAAPQELTQLDEKLYLQVFATPNPSTRKTA